MSTGPTADESGAGELPENLEKPAKGEQRPQTYRPPRGSYTQHSLEFGERKLRYRAVADWVVLRKRDEPSAEMFHVAYLADGETASARPLTFVMNGGPGAASAYLHVGALGPQRVEFDPRGGLLAPPTRLVDNAQTWLAFTDLVFIDPVGTGFSRAVPDSSHGSGNAKEQGGSEKAKRVEKEEQEFFGLNRDLESLCEFIHRFLSSHRRWGSPVFVAGESYGGFRAAKLARKLQEEVGIGLNGTILISPALEWTLLTPSDYDILHWSDAFPSMAAAAFHHGRRQGLAPGADVERMLREAEEFASRELVLYLAQGDAMPEAERSAILARAASLLGLEPDLLARAAARLSPEAFCRELLRGERKVCGRYDATLTAIDPFPDRALHEGPDPTLFSIERAFTAGINTQLRSTLALDTDREYRLLSFDVNRAWKVDTNAHVFQRHVGATDDLRYAMSLNPHMHVCIVHGVYDLVTPYFASKRIVAHMKLEDTQRAHLRLHAYEGGHMFYTWDRSRSAFTQTIAELIRAALRPG